MQINVAETADYRIGAELIREHHLNEAVEAWANAVKSKLKQPGSSDFVHKLNDIVLSVLSQYGNTENHSFNWKCATINYASSVLQLMPHHKKKMNDHNLTRIQLLKKLADMYYQRATDYQKADQNNDALSDVRDAYRTLSEYHKCLTEYQITQRCYAFMLQSIYASFGCTLALLANDSDKADNFFRQAKACADNADKITCQKNATLQLEMQQCLYLLAPTRDIVRKKSPKTSAIKECIITIKRVLENSRDGLHYPHIQPENLLLIAQLLKNYFDNKLNTQKGKRAYSHVRTQLFECTELCFEAAINTNSQESYALAKAELDQINQRYGQQPPNINLRATLLIHAGISGMKRLHFDEAYKNMLSALDLTENSPPSIQLEVGLNAILLPILDRNVPCCRTLLTRISTQYQLLRQQLTLKQLRINKYFQVRDTLETLADTLLEELEANATASHAQQYHPLLIECYQTLESISLAFLDTCGQEDDSLIKQIHLTQYRLVLRKLENPPSLPTSTSVLDWDAQTHDSMPTCSGTGRLADRDSAFKIIQTLSETTETNPELSHSILQIADHVLRENLNCFNLQNQLFKQSSQDSGSIPYRIKINSAIKQRIDYKTAFIELATLSRHIDSTATSHPLAQLLAGTNALENEEYDTAYCKLESVVKALMKNQEQKKIGNITHFIWTCVDYDQKSKLLSHEWALFILKYSDFLLDYMLSFSNIFSTEIIHYQNIIVTTQYQRALAHYNEQQYKPALLAFQDASIKLKAYIRYGLETLKQEPFESDAASATLVTSDVFIAKSRFNLNQTVEAKEAFLHVENRLLNNTRKNIDFKKIAITIQLYLQVIKLTNNPEPMQTYELASLVGKLVGVAESRLGLKHLNTRELADLCRQARRHIMDQNLRNKDPYLPRFIITLFEIEQFIQSQQNHPTESIQIYHTLCQFLTEQNQHPSDNAEGVYHTAMSHSALSKQDLVESQRHALIARQYFIESGSIFRQLESEKDLLFFDILNRDLAKIPEQCRALMAIFFRITKENNAEMIASALPCVNSALRRVIAYCDIERQCRGRHSSHFYHAHPTLIGTIAHLISALDAARSSSAEQDYRVAPLITLKQVDDLIDVAKTIESTLKTITKPCPETQQLIHANGELQLITGWRNTIEQLELRTDNLKIQDTICSEHYLTLIADFNTTKRLISSLHAHLRQLQFTLEFSSTSLMRHKINSPELESISQHHTQQIHFLLKRVTACKRPLHQALCTSAYRMPYFYQYGTFGYSGIQRRLCRSFSVRNLIEVAQDVTEESEAARHNSEQNVYSNTIKKV